MYAELKEAQRLIAIGIIENDLEPMTNSSLFFVFLVA